MNPKNLKTISCIWCRSVFLRCSEAPWGQQHTSDWKMQSAGFSHTALRLISLSWACDNLFLGREWWSDCLSRISAPQEQTHPQGLLLLCLPAQVECRASYQCSKNLCWTNKQVKAMSSTNHHSRTRRQDSGPGRQSRSGNGHDAGRQSSQEMGWCWETV